MSDFPILKDGGHSLIGLDWTVVLLETGAAQGFTSPAVSLCEAELDASPGQCFPDFCNEFAACEVDDRNGSQEEHGEAHVSSAGVQHFKEAVSDMLGIKVE